MDELSQRWKYRIKDWRIKLWSFGVDNMLDEMNEMGEEGCELVGLE